MTNRNTPWPEGCTCWVDAGVDDMDKARAFYGTLFGWEIPEGSPDFLGYTSCTKDGHRVAGMAPKMSPEQPTVWTVYLAVHDLEATLTKVRESGGQVVTDAMDVSDMGRMGLAVDPGGAMVGFWQSGRHTGFELSNEPGSVTWCENFSRAWKTNQDFYAAVVGWEYDDMSADGFEYAVFTVDGQPAGGIGQMDEDWGDLPPYWSTYFKVEDTDQACAEVRRLDGKVLREPWDTPFGRIAAVMDSQGASFMLLADVKPE
jgi:predicted enzyme related to lactoylglutathione lyase